MTKEIIWLKHKSYEKDLEEVRQELLSRSDNTITFQELVERFDKIDKEYNGKLWNLLQIYSNFNILRGKEPCEDAISRQAVIDEIYKSRKNFNNEFDQGFFADKVIALPPVNPQPKTGHWIAQDIYNCHTDFKCSECDYIHSFMHLYGEPTADYTYCPNCGARMVESEVSNAGSN